MSGQFVMVAEILAELSADSRIELVHIPFRFTANPADQGVKRPGKLYEVVLIWIRTISAAWNGRFDVTLYPVGGTSLPAVARDVLTLPIFLVTSHRVVLHFHAGGHASGQWRGGISIRNLARSIYRRADLAIVMTPFNRQDPEHVGVTRVEVIPHRLPDSFDARLLTRGGETANLLYIGHVRPEKGFPEVLEAFAQVAEDHSDIRLTVAGEILPPFTEENLLSLARNLGVEDRIRFIGAVSGSDKSKTFAGADLALFPTRACSETFGLVLIEAMMWKLPVIASDWRGNREVTGEGGTILFPVNDDFSTELKGAIEKAIEQRSSWDEWGTINRSRFLEQFARGAVGTSLADILIDVQD